MQAMPLLPLPDNTGGDYYFPVNVHITYVIRDLRPDYCCASSALPVFDLPVSVSPSSVTQPPVMVLARLPNLTGNPAALRFEVYLLTGTNPTLDRFEIKVFRGAFATSEAAVALVDRTMAEANRLPGVGQD